MNKLPHEHKCRSCGVTVASDCECDDKRVFVLVCEECEDGEGELEF